jgi:subtilisin family serine protease
MRTNLGQMLKGLLELLVGALVTIWELLTGPRDHDEHPLQYFLPGKVILHVDHPAGLDRIQLANLITATTASLWSDRLKPVDPAAILTFPLESAPGQWFSLVPAETTSPDQESLVTLLLDIYNVLNDHAVDASANVFVRAVSPNWLMSSTSHAPNPTSPGSWPVPAPAPNSNNWKFSLLDQQNTTSSPLPFVNEDGAGIDVAILDTAPAKLDLEEAYEHWHTLYDPVEKLLNPNTGLLHVYEGINADIELMESSPVGHRYLMPDHGLFVASIVHSVAPKAKLHLVKAFTPYGTGSTESIAQGILQIIDELRKPEEVDHWRPLIVNCSFGLTIPVPGHDGIPAHQITDFPVELWNPVILRHMSTSLRALFTGLARTQDVLVVAAAGNDSDPTERKPARYPAAYEEILGVGALPPVPSNSTSNYRATTYSNRADDQHPNEGYMTFGGEPGPGKGIRGLYISEFPVYKEGCLSFLWRVVTGKGLDGWEGPGHVPPHPRALTLDQVGYRPNNTGWAWWAGTSFATPIVTGFLATRWSGARQGDALNCASAEAELDSHIRNSRTPQQEKVLHVQQG